MPTIFFFELITCTYSGCSDTAHSWHTTGKYENQR